MVVSQQTPQTYSPRPGHLPRTHLNPHPSTRPPMTDLSPDEIERDLQFAITVAQAAGRRVLALRETGRWEGKMLADVGDQAADGYLQGVIAGRYPEDGILSEETADSPDRLPIPRAWIIDPLDGTKEYSQLREDWAVHVALTLNNECALAAVDLPAQGKTMYPVPLEGHVRCGLTSGEALLSGDSPAPDTIRMACSRSHTPPWMENFQAQLSGTLVREGSVGNKVSTLLLGRADVYVHKIGLKEWDTCAPETIARAAGWHVSKLHGEPHRYNQPDPVNHELVICRPALRDQVLEALTTCGALD